MKNYKIKWMDEYERCDEMTIQAASSMLALDEWGRQMRKDKRHGLTLISVTQE